MLAAVQEAVAGDRKLAFDYTRADGQKGPRTVEPLGVVAKGLTWYLVARGSSGMRTYRVSRMSNVTLLAATFERPAQFDLEAYWKESTARLSEQRGGFEVTLCVSPQAAQRLTEWGAVRPAREDWPAQEVWPGPDRIASGDLASSDADRKPAGWEKLTASFDNEGEAQFVVMGLGSRARVVSPEAFRRRIAEEVEATAGLAGAGLQIKDKLA
jgi:predicted DNA-binding transcriptional regulator YafY